MEELEYFNCERREDLLSFVEKFPDTGIYYSVRAQYIASPCEGILRLLVIRARKWIGWTQYKCADYAGMSRSRLAKFESAGEIGLPDLEKLLEFLPVTMVFPPDLPDSFSTQPLSLKCKELRVRKGLSMEVLSELTGIKVNNLYTFEEGKRGITVREIEKLLHFLGVKL